MRYPAGEPAMGPSYWRNRIQKYKTHQFYLTLMSSTYERLCSIETYVAERKAIAREKQLRKLHRGGAS